MGDTKERYERIQQECIDILGGKCVRCGTNQDLEFDHIDPSTKSFDIAGGSRFSKEKRLAELKKCQLLCVECHRLKTETETLERKSNRPHGTKTRYNQGCRCDTCRKGNTIRMRIYMQRKQAEVAQNR